MQGSSFVLFSVQRISPPTLLSFLTFGLSRHETFPTFRTFPYLSKFNSIYVRHLLHRSHHFGQGG